MKNFKDTLSNLQEKPATYTDQEINEMAEWLGDLTLKQLFYLKESYEALLCMNAFEHQGSRHVH